MTLSASDVAFYHENGFLPVRGVVPPHRTDAMRERIEQLCEDWNSDAARRVGVQQEVDAGTRINTTTSQTVRKFANLVLFEPVFEEHARDSNLLDLVQCLIGLPIALYADQALLKPPLHGSAKLPHQDNAYFRVAPDDAVITCWCALDDATVENGCMHYLPGSHKMGLIEHQDIPGTPHKVPNSFDPENAVAAPIKKGGVIFHHSLTLHFSPDNRTDQWRRAFVCHFVRGDVDMGTRQADPPLIMLREK